MRQNVRVLIDNFVYFPLKLCLFHVKLFNKFDVEDKIDCLVDCRVLLVG